MLLLQLSACDTANKDSASTTASGRPNFLIIVADDMGFTDLGAFGDEVMKTMNIDWVTFEGHRMRYWTPEKGPHYELIREVMMAKIDQNPKVKEVLLSTGDLVLLADHLTTPEDPPAWRYYQIWMEIRESLNE